MDTQYRKNLKAVLTASKDYTDNSIEKLKWELGTYDLSVETINGTTMLLPTPANTIQATMVRIDGASKVSENLIVLNDRAQTTTNGITYSISKGVLTISGTATDSVNISLGLEKTLSAGSYYLELFNWQTNLGIDYYIINQNYTYDFYNTSSGASQIKSMTFNGNELLRRLDVNIANGTVISGTLQLKPMLVKGTTAPTEFSVGFEGVHNLELSGLKVEGANLANPTEIVANHYNFDVDGTQVVDNSRGATDYIEIVGNDYIVSSSISVGFIEFAFYDSNKNFISIAYTNNQTSFKPTIPSGAKYFRLAIQYNSSLNISTDLLSNAQLMLNYGSVAKTYVPYITPTTLPIDLTSIEDSSGNKLFADGSLKGVGNVADEITPYKAIKRIDSRAYQSGDEEDSDVITDGTNTLYVLTTPIEVSIDWSDKLVKFEAYSNGSITLVNTNNQDTTSTFKYLKEVAK